MKWFVRGDIDGFFGLALDNLVQLILIVTLCQGILGFSSQLIYGTILPGVAVSLLVGNTFYALQAKKLSNLTGRLDVCALPYGVNTVSLFAHVFLIMLPATLSARQSGLDIESAAIFAWKVGLLACLGSGIIELVGAIFAGWIRRSSPRAALLSTLAGIALGFISFSFLFRTYAFPIVGLTTLGIILMTYFGRVHFKGKIPGGLVAILLGTALAWGTGDINHSGPPTLSIQTINFPHLVINDLFDGFSLSSFFTYFSIIFPMGIFNVLGSLQNIESAEAAGDSYPTAPSLTVNGLGSIAAAAFGSCFPTTIYIGHPGWKALGARAGYSILNGLFCTLISITGTLAWITWAIPIEAGMAIVLWIGIVMTAQAFQATSKEHAPAVVLGLLPGLGAWGALMAKDGLRAGGANFSQDVIEKFHAGGNYIDGAFALEQGFIFTAMILSAVTVHLIDRCFNKAAIWCGIAALMSFTGLIHSYSFIRTDTVSAFGQPATVWGFGYFLMGLVFLTAKWFVIPNDEPTSQGPK